MEYAGLKYSEKGSVKKSQNLHEPELSLNTPVRITNPRIHPY